MEDLRKPETGGQEPSNNHNNNEPAGEPASGNEKLFTQDEVNEIIKNRLKRHKDNGDSNSEAEAALKNRENELNSKENKLKCREYLIDNKLPGDLLEILDTSDFERFKEKASKAQSLLAPKKSPAPLADNEPALKREFSAVFKGNTKRKPKNYYYGE